MKEIIKILENKRKSSVEFRRVEIAKDLTVDVRQYLGVTEKTMLVVTAVNHGVVEDKFLKTMSDLAFKLEIIKYYTGIDYTKADFEKVDLFSIYDLYMSTGLYEKVINAIPKVELDNLVEMYNSRIFDQQLERSQENSISATLDKVGEFINSFLDKYNNGELEDYIEEVKDSLKDLDPEKLEYINAFMEKVES